MNRSISLGLVCLLLAGCGTAVNPQGVARPADRVETSKRTTQTLYALSPATAPLIAAYPTNASGQTTPAFVLKGPDAKVFRSPGSLGVDSSGAIFAIAGRPVKLLEFSRGSRGEAAPKKIVRMPSSFIPGGDGVGFAMDGSGNFWTTGNRRLMRFSLTASGSAQPNLTIAPVIATPIGNLRATPLNVALDAQGNVYCACEVVANGGAQASGISEYSVGASGKVRLVRTFYDLSTGDIEVPPQSIAVDSTGAMYLASTQGRAGVRIYSAQTHSGSARPTRYIAGSELDYISALAVDSSNNLFVAVSKGIAVFGPAASGTPKPNRWILDPAHLAYGDTSYAGTLLVIR